MSKTDSKLITEGNITKPACYRPVDNVLGQCQGFPYLPHIEECNKCFLYKRYNPFVSDSQSNI